MEVVLPHALAKRKDIDDATLLSWCVFGFTALVRTALVDVTIELRFSALHNACGYGDFTKPEFKKRFATVKRGRPRRIECQVTIGRQGVQVRGIR